jgi:hypothetical protein
MEREKTVEAIKKLCEIKKVEIDTFAVVDIM